MGVFIRFLYFSPLAKTLFVWAHVVSFADININITKAGVEDTTRHKTRGVATPGPKRACLAVPLAHGRDLRLPVRVQHVRQQLRLRNCKK